MTGTRTTPRRSWSALVLLTFGAIFVVTVGTIQNNARGSIRSETSVRPELASAAGGLSWLGGGPAHGSTDAPFPILTIVGGGFVGMTLALHVAARRLAQ